MVDRWLRTLLYLLATVPLAAAGLAVLIAGWVLVICLAITPLVVPALLACRTAVGGGVRLDAAAANELLGTSAQAPLRSPGPRGFWRAGWNVLVDAAFWRQQSYLLVRLSLGFAAAVGMWSLLVASVGAATMPVWYRFTDVEVAGGRHVDSLGRALLCVPAGLAGIALTLALLGPVRVGSRFLVSVLLQGSGVADHSPAVRRLERRRALEAHALAYGVVNLFLIVVWALTGHGAFWPEWTLIVFGLPLAAHAWVYAVDEWPARTRPWGLQRSVAHLAGLAAALSLFFVLVWAVTGHGSFWPAWPILVLALALAVHIAVAATQHRSHERIAVLEETRAGAVDQQESELERIERDLHDGAQARLVALGMSLGMAEQKLASDPAAAQALLAEARRGTQEALAELRSLARGIHPPVLADRGLAAAISALADGTPLQVAVGVDVPRRPPRAVETAAYFVVAEALANSGKHAKAGRVDISVRSEDDRLVVEVVDDGAGGADPAGNGLRGLARRVEALDGRLDVESPAGGPTTIRAVIPCAS